MSETIKGARYEYVIRFTRFGGVNGMEIFFEATIPPDEIVFRDAVTGRTLGKIAYKDIQLIPSADQKT